MTSACNHPQVRVVAREDDIEFVECQSCREIFDAAEYVDMAIEAEEQAAEPDAAPTGVKAGHKTARKRR